MIAETRKIMHEPDLRISTTCVRIPVFIGHSHAVHAEFERPISPDDVRAILRQAPGVAVQDDLARERLPDTIDGGRAGHGASRAHPQGCVVRQRHRDVDFVGQHPQGRGTQRDPDRRGNDRAWVGLARFVGNRSLDAD